MSGRTPYVTTDRVVEDVRTVAHQLGYAIAVHGSLRPDRDIDLIAAPWTDEARSYRRLVKEIARIPYLWRPTSDDDTQKPHGRLGAVFHIRDRKVGCPVYVDLSVMPRRRDCGEENG